MRRRGILKATLATTTATSLAGCSGLLSEQSRTTRQTARKTESEPKLPTVSWDETWLQGDKYAVTAKGNFRDMDRLAFKIWGDKKIASVSGNPGQSFSKKIAGKGASHDSIRRGKSIDAVVPGKDRLTNQAGHFVVGSQEQPSFPRHLYGLSGSTIPDLSTGKTLKQEFEQTVNGRKTVLTAKVPKALYDYYKDRKRILDWGTYVSDTLDDGYINGLVRQLRAFADRHGYSDRQLVNHAVAVVQQMKYTQDKPTTGYNEYPKFPVETLVDRGGDCEDSCILLAELLQKLGYGVVLLVIRDAQHMALGVTGDDSLEGAHYDYKGQRYYYLETTAGGWEVGQVPKQVRNSNGKAKIHEVKNNPVLVHQWGLSGRAKGGVKATVGVQNVGDATAKTAEVQVRFEDGSGKVVTSKRNSVPPIRPKKHKEVSMTLVPPDNKKLRAHVRVFLDGKLHDESKSEYQKPKEQ